MILLTYPHTAVVPVIVCIGNPPLPGDMATVKVLII